MGRVEVSAVQETEKPCFSAILRVYLSELFVFSGEKIANRTFDYRHLDAYWIEPDRWPFWIISDGRICGFALVRRREDSVFEMAEFYVDPASRRGGVGSKAAMLLFRRFSGKWCVSAFAENSVAVMFWRNLAKEFDSAERFAGNRVEQTFDTSRGAAGKQSQLVSPQI